MVPVADAGRERRGACSHAFARHIGDREVRRRATVGGNLCAPPGREAQRGDLGAPLIALGARVRSTGSGGERTEPVEDFLAGDRAGRLVLEVEYDLVRRWSAPRRCAAATRTPMRSRTSRSARPAKDCASASPAIGPAAVRCRTVEQSRNPDDVLKDVDPVDDAVASAEYRRQDAARARRAGHSTMWGAHER